MAALSHSSKTALLLAVLLVMVLGIAAFQVGQSPGVTGGLVTGPQDLSTTAPVFLAVGTTAIPSMQAVGSASNTGMVVTTSALCWDAAGVVTQCLVAGGVEVANSKAFALSSTSGGTGSIDGGMTRGGAAIIDFGNGTAASTVAKVQASGYLSLGTKFTTNNGCTDSATAGGATAGTFTVASTSCTEIITMGDTATAPNGWSCTAIDITTLADVINPHQTTTTTTTATIVTGTVVSGDKIQFSCIGY